MPDFFYAYNLTKVKYLRILDKTDYYTQGEIK